MAERVLKCPVCSGPLSPSRFARSVVCSYCGATVQLDEATVSAARFRDALRAWDDPARHRGSLWIGDGHWALEVLLARGEISDVHAARRARWPTERVVLKVLRDRRAAALFAHEWEILRELHRSEASGADHFSL